MYCHCKKKRHSSLQELNREDSDAVHILLHKDFCDISSSSVFPLYLYVIPGRRPALLTNYPAFLLKILFSVCFQDYLSAILASALCLFLDAINLTYIFTLLSSRMNIFH